MNHRERILAAVDRKPVDRIPTDLWATPEVLEKLFDHFGVSRILDLYDSLGVDGILRVEPAYKGPRLKSEGDYWEDYWGIGHTNLPYRGGVYPEFSFFPLAKAETIADLRSYRWPSPDWFDYSVIADQAAAYSGRALVCGYTALFHFHNKLRGLEESLVDPLLRPEFTRYLIARVSEFFEEYHLRCFQAAPGLIDLTEVTDDWGSQSGLLSSPKIFEEFYREPMQRAMDLACRFGIRIFHHDDGDMREMIPSLIEMGIHVLNPIQWRSGDWDLPALKRDYGNSLCFHGGIDNQQTMPFGSPADIETEVKRLIQALASDGTGLILAPCHNLQADTPVENILTLYRAAKDHGAVSAAAKVSSWGRRLRRSMGL